MRPLSLLCLFALPAVGLGQGTAADYERAATLDTRTQGKVFRANVVPVWADDGETLRYTVDLPGGAKGHVVVDLAKGERRAVSAEAWAKLPKPVKPVEPPPRPNAGANRGPRRSNVSPDGKWRVEVADDNLVLREVATKAETTLTKEGKKADAYTGEVFWSPDSAKFVAHRRTPGGDRRVTLVESSPKDQLQPKTSSYFYLKPGDAIPQAKPHLFDVATRAEIPVPDALFANPWDVSYEHWSPDSKAFTFLYNQRGHQVVRVNRIDAETGAVTAVVSEECATFFDYTNKLFLRYLDATGELLWMSERTGWNHLYLIDAATGRVKNAVTGGDWLVRGVEAVDVEARRLRLRFMGRHAGQDPYHVHYATVGLDGSGFTPLTEGDGTHALTLSPDGRFAIDRYSRVDLPTVTELRRVSDGKLVCGLEKADDSALRGAGWAPPERFVAKGRDGATDIHGVICRPTDFDPARRYKVIESIYAGPHDQHVPKAFRPSPRPAQRMAELGFVVVMIDGMGTNWRSKAFHDVCHKNLADSGLPDRVAWIRAAAKRHPEMDIAGGVGIFGGSAGGQSSTRALLAHGDFYTVAVSDCGCHDNRLDKIWWNEMWMGWPVGQHYEEQSNATQAHKLKGKLLLVVGELDRNVDPASTLQLASALVKADKDFDLLVVPGAGHGSAEAPYGTRRRADFFVRHLGGVEPRR